MLSWWSAIISWYGSQWSGQLMVYWWLIIGMMIMNNSAEQWLLVVDDECPCSVHVFVGRNSSAHGSNLCPCLCWSSANAVGQAAGFWSCKIGDHWGRSLHWAVLQQVPASESSDSMSSTSTLKVFRHTCIHTKFQWEVSCFTASPFKLHSQFTRFRCVFWS